MKLTLLPVLRQSSIVMIDNTRSHYVKAVREILEMKGMNGLFYLTPDSPDINHIKKMCPKIKMVLFE